MFKVLVKAPPPERRDPFACESRDIEIVVTVSHHHNRDYQQQQGQDPKHRCHGRQMDIINPTCRRHHQIQMALSARRPLTDIMSLMI